MAHEQGNKPTVDPSKYGLKFDSEKPSFKHTGGGLEPPFFLDGVGVI